MEALTRYLSLIYSSNFMISSVIVLNLITPFLNIVMPIG